MRIKPSGANRMTPNKGNISTKNPISPEVKEAIKEDLKTLKEGGYDKTVIEILPSGVRTATDYQEIVDVIRGGKAYVLEVNVTRNVIYHMRKKLSKEYGIENLRFGTVKGTKNTALYLS